MNRRSLRTRRAHRPPATRLAVGVLVSVAALAPAASVPAADAAVIDDGTHLVMTDVTSVRLSRHGGSGEITARVANRSLRDATGVTTRFELPPDVHLVDEASPGCSERDRRVACSIGSVAVGRSAPVRFVVRADGQARTAIRSFLPPLSDQYDPFSGELLMRTWNHEADGQDAPLARCWPVAVGSPNTDVAGGGNPFSPACDGRRDMPDLPPDTIDVLAAFPEAFTAKVTRSWEWTTVVTPPASGSYRVCAYDIDDGAYLAIAPVGRTMTDADLVLAVDAFGSLISAPFALSAGVEYQVLFRVSNRGGIGIDNGGGFPGGWGSVGIAPADVPCSPGDVANLGIDGWVTRTPIAIDLADVTDLGIGGAVSGPRTDGRVTAARVENHGPDSARGTVTFDMATEGAIPRGVVGCAAPVGSTSATCSLGALGEGASTVLTVSAQDGTRGGHWSVRSADSIDTNPLNDRSPTL